ncbi:hypothetical protein ABTZ03_15465 [Kitasatospora sp. NPDC096077]
MLLLSAELRLERQTPETAAYLRTLLPASGSATPIPAAAYSDS